MIILSCTTQDRAGIQLTEIQRQSAVLCGFQPHEHVSLPIPHHYNKHPSWFRIRALLDHLHNHDMILWMDTDAMLLRPLDKGTLFRGEHTLYASRDRNGLNHGVACWRNTPKAREILWEIYDSHWQFRNHPWHEQGALHTMQERIDIGWIPKQWFNAYPEDVSPESYILHLPNRPNEDRLAIMRNKLEELKKKA